MKIKLSKSQWEFIGKQAKWMKKAVKGASIPANIRSKIANEISAKGSFFDKIPLDDYFDILKKYNIFPIQEDGTPWSGFLVGGGECGSEQAKQQRANIDLVFEKDGLRYPVKNAAFQISWCKMPSGKYEVVAYVG